MDLLDAFSLTILLFAGMATLLIVGLLLTYAVVGAVDAYHALRAAWRKRMAAYTVQCYMNGYNW